MAEGDKGRFARFFDFSQSVLTCCALLLAGWWFIAERKSTVHANLTVEAGAARIDRDLVFIQGTIKTDNVGHVALETDEWVVRLMSVIPSQLPIKDIAGLQLNAWPHKLSADPGAPIIYEDHQLQWYKIREFAEPYERMVEPGETDIKHIDFIVSCKVQLASLAAWVKKPATSHWFGLKTDKEQWWSARTLVPLQKLCGKPIGSTMELASGAK